MATVEQYQEMCRRFITTNFRMRHKTRYKADRRKEIRLGISELRRSLEAGFSPESFVYLNAVCGWPPKQLKWTIA